VAVEVTQQPPITLSDCQLSEQVTFYTPQLQIEIILTLYLTVGLKLCIGIKTAVKNRVDLRKERKPKLSRVKSAHKLRINTKELAGLIINKS
jgi:hypothetical protein